MWLPEGFTALQPGVTGSARYRLGAERRHGSSTWVLLPGMEGDARCFAQQLPLADRRAVVAHDLPSADGVDLPDLARLLEPDLPPGPLLLVGASLGGLLGRALASAWPGRVRGLVTIGSLPHLSLLPKRLGPLGALAGRLPAPVFGRLYRRRIARRLSEEGVDDAVTYELLAGLPAAGRHRARLAAISAWGLAPGCPVPTLSLRGQVDREAPWRGADVARVLPESGFETVPGGHRCYLTHPRPLHDVLEAFSASLPRP